VVVNPLLDNIIWHALAGPQAGFSTGTDRARRYAPGFSPILGFATPRQPAFADLLPFTQPGEHFYCEGWDGPVPAGWKIEEESTMYRMVWAGTMPDRDEAGDAVPLDAARHAGPALELATLTHPGPFGPRTLELGEYFGLFAGPRLIAMAGERMQAGAFREISGVCTDPEFQGRGHARRLMVKLIRRQLQRGQIPFLHVMRDNVAAHRFYERLGFRDAKEPVVRVVSRT
jgi:ribosomal protein S18 acetylase RimI-like enzyme